MTYPLLPPLPPRRVLSPTYNVYCLLITLLILCFLISRSLPLPCLPRPLPLDTYPVDAPQRFRSLYPTYSGITSTIPLPFAPLAPPPSPTAPSLTYLPDADPPFRNIFVDAFSHAAVRPFGGEEGASIRRKNQQ